MFGNKGTALQLALMVAGATWTSGDRALGRVERGGYSSGVSVIGGGYGSSGYGGSEYGDGGQSSSYDTSGGGGGSSYFPSTGGGIGGGGSSYYPSTGGGGNGGSGYGYTHGSGGGGGGGGSGGHPVVIIQQGKGGGGSGGGGGYGGGGGGYGGGGGKGGKGGKLDSTTACGICSILAPLALLGSVIPLLGVGMVTISSTTTGRRRRSVSVAEQQERLTEINNIQQYIEESVGVEVERKLQEDIVVKYLECSGLTTPSNHCLEHLSCAFQDPSYPHSDKEKATSNVVLRIILQNELLDDSLKTRIEAAGQVGLETQGSCHRLFPCTTSIIPGKNTGTSASKTQLKSSNNNRTSTFKGGRFQASVGNTSTHDRNSFPSSFSDGGNSLAHGELFQVASEESSFRQELPLPSLASELKPPPSQGSPTPVALPGKLSELVDENLSEFEFRPMSPSGIFSNELPVSRQSRDFRSGAESRTIENSRANSK